MGLMQKKHHTTSYDLNAFHHSIFRLQRTRTILPEHPV